MDEWFDVVDETGKAVGRALRSECHGNPALMHPSVHVLVFNAAGRLFLQKRSERKDIQPGRWDSSVGGHLHPGEAAKEGARREMREELGVKAGRLDFLHHYIWRSPVETEWVRTFRTVHEGPFRLDPEEISEGRFWSLEEIREALGHGVFTPNFEQECKRFCL